VNALKLTEIKILEEEAMGGCENCRSYGLLSTEAAEEAKKEERERLLGNKSSKVRLDNAWVQGL
jgi:hypothetical protein